MEVSTQVISKIDLFPFYRAFFCNDGTWEQLTDQAKMAHVFMLYRLLAIEYPEYIQNINKVHSVHIVNSLHNAFKNRGKQPGWAYTSAKKRKDEDILKPYPEYLIQSFIKNNDIEEKSFQFFLETHPKEVTKYLDQELKAYNQKPKAKKR